MMIYNWKFDKNDQNRKSILIPILLLFIPLVCCDTPKESSSTRCFADYSVYLGSEDFVFAMQEFYKKKIPMGGFCQKHYELYECT